METNDVETLKIMTATLKPVIELIEQRMNTRIDTLTTLVGQPLENLPESIKLKREEEAAKLRAVIQEQRDIVAIIKAIFPDV